jgi:hypothetical protein
MKDEHQAFTLGGQLRMKLEFQNGRVISSAFCSGKTIWSEQPWRMGFETRDRDGGLGWAKELRLEAHKAWTSDGLERLELDLVPDGWVRDIRHDVVIRLGFTCSTAEGWIEQHTSLVNRDSRELAPVRFSLHWGRTADGCISSFAIPFGAREAVHRPTVLAEGSNLQEKRDGFVLYSGDDTLLAARLPSDREEWMELQSDGKTAWFGGVPNGLADEFSERWIVTGEEWDFGTVRWIPGQAGVRSALIEHRHFMAERGVRAPADYNPPLNYCVFYECGCYWKKEDLLRSLEAAADLGCELLYTDQGWETDFGSGIWDEERLGSCHEMVEEAASRGMQMGVLVSLHSRQPVFPSEWYKKDTRGVMMSGDCWGDDASTHAVCPVVPAWREEKTRRLVKLVDDGVRFFSFDFNDSHAECRDPLHQHPWPVARDCRDPMHGHGIPLLSFVHARAVAAQQTEIKVARPEVLIEAHDTYFAGSKLWPVHFFHESCHERWGFEYMWHGINDLSSGLIHNLYWYNLAYDKPLYLHQNLAKDNDHLAVFWYLASTVRHLGIGNGTALTPERYALVKTSLAAYRRLRRYFVAGEFDGPEPTVHVRRLAGQGSVVLIFNDRPEPASRKVELDAAMLGCVNLSQIQAVDVFGPSVRVDVLETATFSVELPPYAVSVCEIRVPEMENN